MKISIIIPCYNESRNIKTNVENKVIPFMEELKIDYEIKTDSETVDLNTSLPKKYIEIPSNCWAKVK